MANLRLFLSAAFTFTHLAQAAPPPGTQYACRIANGAGQTVEIPNCLPSCQDSMTEACCNEIIQLGVSQGLGFSTLQDRDFVTLGAWNKNFFNTGKSACVFQAPHRFGREGILNMGGVAKHVILEGTPRKSCDGGDALEKGTMVHFACSTLIADMDPSGKLLGSAQIIEPSRPTVDCDFASRTKTTGGARNTFRTAFFHIPRGIADAATSKTGDATLSTTELQGLASDLEGTPGIASQINGYDPTKQYFRVEIKGQASCGVKGSPAQGYCEDNQRRWNQQFQADLAQKRGLYAINHYPAYLKTKAGWTQVAATAQDVTMTKSISGKLITIKLVLSSPEVKMCSTAVKCKKVQGVTSLIFKRNLDTAPTTIQPIGQASVRPLAAPSGRPGPAPSTRPVTAPANQQNQRR